MHSPDIPPEALFTARPKVSRRTTFFLCYRLFACWKQKTSVDWRRGYLAGVTQRWSRCPFGIAWPAWRSSWTIWFLVHCPARLWAYELARSFLSLYPHFDPLFGVRAHGHEKKLGGPHLSVNQIYSCSRAGDGTDGVDQFVATDSNACTSTSRTHDSTSRWWERRFEACHPLGESSYHFTTSDALCKFIV